ncbi:MAG: response regulator [Candidatus Marinimicrobia bacterium]|nr:response regulator [Candidatus Neomarinimicrobiota bacterium]
MGKRILIVDDEEFFIQPIKILLERNGYEIHIASDGMSGLQKARVVNPDLIMLDLMLPGIDGYQICRLLKFDEKFKKIPVIIVSAKDTDHDRELGFKSGADSYITKPLNPSELLAEFDKLLVA